MKCDHLTTAATDRWSVVSESAEYKTGQYSHIHTQSQYGIDSLESLTPYLCYTYILHNFHIVRTYTAHVNAACYMQ